MKLCRLSALLATLLLSIGCQGQKEPQLLIRTTLGDITVKLYNETPQHRDNFLKLAADGFYDSLLFHRVIREFMIQAGDPASRTAQPEQMLGSGGPGHQVAAEILPQLFHKRGALAAARQPNHVNPERASSGSQFYIVQGRVMQSAELDQVERQLNTQRNGQGIRSYLADPANQSLRDSVIRYQQLQNGHALDSVANLILDTLRTRGQLADTFRFSQQQRQVYSSLGGAPFLDTEYTVFGEVTKGMEVVDLIAQQATGAADRPLSDVRILAIKRLDK